MLGVTLKMTADTLQTFTKPNAWNGRGGKKINHEYIFPYPRGKDILFTTHFFWSLYPVNEISNKCEVNGI